ncbi:MAG: abortive infection system antitoxin AbiGi family protein [Spirochaetota bacterium]
MENNNYYHILPGTVSKIVWHFTGGPLWDDTTKKQKDERKSDDDAYNNLYNIIKTKELAIGHYKEVIHYTIPRRYVFDADHNRQYFEENIPSVIESKPICCVAEIPIQHLFYHSHRYGKFAIGFYRESLLRNNFNPVLYTLSNDNFIYHILQAHESSKLVGEDISTIPEIINELIDKFQNSKLPDDGSKTLTVIKKYMNIYGERVKHIELVLQTIISFIKTINKNEFDTIYCEREWRSTDSFKFNFNDVAFIVMPKSYFINESFNDSIIKISEELSIPRYLPIVPWEDLIEH